MTETDDSADQVTFRDTLNAVVSRDKQTIKITGQRIENGEIFNSEGTGLLSNLKLKATIRTTYSRGGVATINYDFDKQ